MSNMKRYIETVQEQADEAFRAYVEGDLSAAVNPHGVDAEMANEIWQAMFDELKAEYDAWIDGIDEMVEADRILEAGAF